MGRSTSMALCLGACMAAVGCASQTGFGRASTLGQGELEGQAAVTASVASVHASPGDPTPLPWLDLELGAHYGLTDGVDVGARLWGVGIRGLGTWGVALDTKIALLRSDEEGTGWNIAVAGAASYHQILVGGTPTHLLSFTLPVLFGHDFGDDQLVFGPRVVGNLWTGQGQGTIETLSWGLSLGYSIGLGERWQLMPEVVLLYTPVSMNGEMDDPDRSGAGFLHLAVGGAYRF